MHYIRVENRAITQQQQKLEQDDIQVIKETGVKITQKKASAGRDEFSTNMYQASTMIQGFSPRTGGEKGRGAAHFRWDTDIMNMRTEVGDAAFHASLQQRLP